jgi:hypothetical protein
MWVCLRLYFMREVGREGILKDVFFSGLPSLPRLPNIQTQSSHAKYTKYVVVIIIIITQQDSILGILSALKSQESFFIISQHTKVFGVLFLLYLHYAYA